MTWIAVFISLMVLAVAVASVPAVVALMQSASGAGDLTRAVSRRRGKKLTTASEPAVLAGKTDDVASLTNGLQHPTDFRPAVGASIAEIDPPDASDDIIASAHAPKKFPIKGETACLVAAAWLHDPLARAGANGHRRRTKGEGQLCQRGITG